MSNLPFPEKILHQHIATLGKTGAGKSSAMRVIAEHLLDKERRLCVVDPKGDWWGLKSSADGKSAGYPVIMFGDFKESRATDVPINDRSGKHVAELIASGNRPCVLGFRGWMPAQLVRFWLDFAPTLFNTNSGELYVLIDEVQNFAPKGKIFDPDAGKCLHWTNRIMSEGRGLGLTFFIASQRPQKVHNDTLDCCETLVAMRVAHPAARQSIQDWIDGNGDPKVGKEVVATLASLARGEAWIWSPENEFGPKRIQFPMFQTFDSFAPPQVQKKVSQTSWAEVNLDQVREKLSAVIAETKANDPRELKAEVARLKVELSKKQVAVAPVAPVSDSRVIERAVAAAVKPYRDQLAKVGRAALIGEKFLKLVDDQSRGLHEIFTSLGDVTTELPPAPAPLERPIAPPRMSVAQLKSAPPTNGNNGNGELSRPQFALLQRLAEFAAIGKKQVNLAWLAASLETTVRARGFEENMRQVRAQGFVVTGGDHAELTVEGAQIAGHVEAPSDIKERICEMLSGPQAQLFRYLDGAYPTAYTLESIAETFGTTVRARGFEENIRFLRSNELITVAQGGAKRAEWIGSPLQSPVAHRPRRPQGPGQNRLAPPSLQPRGRPL